MSNYLMCPNCQAGLENYDGKDIVYCNYCRKSVILNNAKILAENYAKILQSGREIDLNNLRKLIRQEMGKHSIDVNMVKNYCGEILQLLPDDYLASFYKVYCERAAKPKDFIDFFSIPLNNVDEFAIIEILDILTKNAEIKFKDIVGNYINRAGINTEYYLKKFNAGLEEAERDVERFSRQPRDVFICYVSNDLEKAEKVHSVLFKENISCFFAPYNLKQTTTESYWNSLRYAILNCKVFLVISSYFTEFNPVEKNDALKEMDIAEENDRIQRLEFKIDRPDKRTSKFKRFFENSWIEAYGDKFDSGIEELLNCIFECTAKFNRLKAEKDKQKPFNEISEVEIAARIQKEAENKVKMQQEEAELLRKQQEESDKKLKELQEEIERLKKRQEASYAEEDEDEDIDEDDETEEEDDETEDEDEDIEDDDEIEDEDDEENYDDDTRLEDFEIENGELINYRGNGGNITIPGSVTSIGEWAFEDCDNLMSIVIPGSVTNIGNEAFDGCSSLIKINVNDSNKNFSSIDGILYNKEKSTIIRYPAGKTEKSFTIPGSVTNMGEGAFEDCSNLMSITIPGSVKSIGDWAFSNCSSLKSITIPGSVTSIGNFTFYDCSSLIQISVNGNNKNFSSIDGVLYDKGKSNLIRYPAGKTEKSFTIRDGVTSIGERAFEDCDNLTSITIPDGVTSIENCAFSDCYNLTSIAIPGSVTNIGEGAFVGCISLIKINVNDINKNFSSINGVLYDKGKSNLIRYPAGKTEKSFTIPDGVTSIGELAFSGCVSLTSIMISDSVTSIGNFAFYDWTENQTIYVNEKQSKKWNEKWKGFCRAKIIYR